MLPWQEDFASLGGRLTSAFHLEGSREDSLVSTATPRATLPTLSPGWETISAEVPPPAASPQFQIPRVAAQDEPLRRFVHQSAKETTKANPQPCALRAVPYPRVWSPRGGDGFNWA